jgi:hypothetical protein
MGSKPFALSDEDIARILHNAYVFLAPLALVYLVFVSGNLQDGFALSDLYPNQEVLGAIVLYIVNFLTDFTRKFLADNTK